jgi:hypothetical protein
MNAQTRYREQFHSPSPRANTVRPLMFTGEHSTSPDRPCFRCGAKGECKHRGVYLLLDNGRRPG